MTKFKKGESGNPAGRPRGTGQVAALRKAIAEDLPEIIDAVVAQAQSGDVGAAKLLLDRVLPVLKPIDQPVVLAGDLSGTLAEQGFAVIRSMGQGTVSPDEAKTLLAALAAQARIVELADLEKRIAALEEAEHGR